MINLYLIYRTDNVDYDEYEGAVVAAESSEAVTSFLTHYPDYWGPSYTVSNPKVEIKLIGTAADDIPEGMIMESFNAG